MPPRCLLKFFPSLPFSFQKLYLARKNKCVVCEYSPQQIKIAVTGYGKSDKRQVMGMVKRLMPDVPDGALDDEYDAIAVGITALASIREISTH